MIPPSLRDRESGEESEKDSTPHQGHFDLEALPSVFHQDERYWLGKGGIWKRGIYAASRILIIGKKRITRTGVQVILRHDLIDVHSTETRCPSAQEFLDNPSHTRGI